MHETATVKPAAPGPFCPARLAEIAHELRTPLGGVEAMAEALCAAGLPAEQERVAQALLASARHLRVVASAVLTELGDGQPAKDELTAVQPVDLAAFLEPIAAAATVRASRAGLGFSCRVNEGVPARLLLRATSVRRMIENVLDNAFKATAAGEIKLSIDRIGRRKGLHELRFAVRDTGMGFDPHAPAETPSGSGLGLLVVRTLAGEMGGVSAAESRPGAGATVWFTLLAASEGAPASSRRGKPPRIDEPGRGRILVVDDNGPSRTVLALVLEQFGFGVEEAASGEAALARVPEGGFAAVMMDMTMTGLDGAATTRAIRALGGAAAAVPVIAVTGRVSEADQRAFREAGASAVSSKPISPGAIWQALTTVGLVETRPGTA